MIHLSLLTPQKSFLKLEVSDVTLPTEKGQLMVLPGHARLVGKLMQGSLSCRLAHEQKQFDISGGVFEIKQDEITVLADQAELMTEANTQGHSR